MELANGGARDRERGGVLITLVTGVLLMFYYKPYPDAAYAPSRTSTSSSRRDVHPGIHR